MKNIKHNVISKKFINEINEAINNKVYSDSLWIFCEDDEDLIKNISSNLKSNEFMKNYLFDDSYIVVRCVKTADTKRCYESHFDNYKETFVIPLLIPTDGLKGELNAWFFARREPKNIIEHILTKALYQNALFRYFIRKYLQHKFVKIEANPGDVAFFDGFTTLHYNNPVEGERRSILIHNKKPFQNSFAVNLIESFSKYHVK